MSERLRWGILGTGMIARKFAGELPESGTGVLAATASRALDKAEEFVRDFEGRAHGSYDELLEDVDVDAVYISLPNGMHKEWSIKTMEAGKHVLCEKPLAGNAKDAEEMFTISEKTGKILIEAFMYRAAPGTEELIRAVRSGVIGEPRLIRTNFTFCREANPKDARYHPEQSGGSLMDVGCYCVNFARALAGREPTDMEAMAHLHPMGVDDYAAGVLRFGDGLLVTFTCGMTVESDASTHIAGTDGRIDVDAFWFNESGFRLTKVGQSEVVGTERDRGLYALEADAFAAAVAGEAEPWISKEDSLGNMRALDELRRKAGVPLG